MKMTFDIAAPVATRFKSAIPRGGRSPLVTKLIEKALGGAEADLEAACQKANNLNLDLKDWENLNESETW